MILVLSDEEKRLRQLERSKKYQKKRRATDPEYRKKHNLENLRNQKKNAMNLVGFMLKQKL